MRGQGTEKVALLISMDVAGVFDMLSHQRPLHSQQKIKTSIWLINWAKGFITDRKSTLVIYSKLTEEL